MKPRRGQATTMIGAPPDDVFARIAHIDDGPEWTTRRGRLVVRSTVIERDPAERRFAYRSKLEGDNPSFSVWSWQVDPVDGGRRSRVTLAWELRPVTFVRKRVISIIRNRYIARAQAPAALAALSR